MAPNEPENKVESAETSTSGKVKDTEANKEAREGKEDLVKQQKEKSQAIKDGSASSGVSGLLGKIKFTEMAKTGKKAAEEITKIFKGEQAHEELKAAAAEAKAAGDSKATVDSKSGDSKSSADAKTAGDSKATQDAKAVEDKKSGDGRSSPGGVEMDPEIITVQAPPYKGEDIKVDVNFGHKEGQPGDTVDSIAKDHLPPTATPDQVEAYKKEIAIVNGLDPANPGDLTGKDLKLPGHDASGAMTLVDDSNVTTVTWPDGTYMISEPGGRGYINYRNSDGSVEESHWGPRPHEDFTLTHTPDGKTYIQDGDDKSTKREVPPANEDIAVERQKMLELANEKIKNPEERAKFEADMLRFEERAAKQVPPLSPEEVLKTYKETERLLEATGDVPLTEEERVRVAEQAMSQLADPKSIDQGYHETCNVTTVETTLYTKHPSDAIKLVADVAIDGEYTTPGGVHVTVDPRVSDDEAAGHPPNDGDRSHASQIFQVTAVNLYYQTQPYTYTDASGNQKTVPAGQMEYKQVPNTPGTVPPDGGERLYDNSTTPPTVIMKDWTTNEPEDSPSLDDRAMVDVPNMITNTNDSIYIGNEVELTPEHTGVIGFKNEAEMEDYIKQAKADGDLPIILKVHTGQEPFLHDSGGGSAGGSGGYHVVTITDYDPVTRKVKIDNQWGSSADHQGDKGVHMDDLYRATLNPATTETVDAPWYKPWKSTEEVNPTIRDLESVVEWDREHGTIDTQKEFELLRLKNKYGDMSDEDYDEALKEAIEDATERWQEQKDNGTLNESEHEAGMTKIKEMVNALPSERKPELLVELRDKGLIDEERFRQVLAGTTLDHANEEHTPEEDKEFMEKIKSMTDEFPADVQEKFYNAINNGAEDPAVLLELAQYEGMVGAITPEKQNELILKATEEFQKTERTAGETAAYAARMVAIIGSMPEEQAKEVLSKVYSLIAPKDPSATGPTGTPGGSPTPAPAPAPAPTSGDKTGGDAARSKAQIEDGGFVKAGDAGPSSAAKPQIEDGGFVKKAGDAGQTMAKAQIEDGGFVAGDGRSEKKAVKKPDDGVIHMEPEVIEGKRPYMGEKDLNIDLEPKVVKGKAGDTIESLAASHLPPDATPEQIANHAVEIATVNGLDPNNPGDLTGKDLSLPGHTPLGGFIVENKDHVTTTRYKDGTVLVESKNGDLGYAQVPTGNGSYEESHWGPRAGDRFVITHTPDGKMKIQDNAGDSPREITPASPEVQEEREKLMDKAAEKITDPEKLAKFKADMLRFEERAAKQVPPLSPEEVAKTYREAERLLNATGDTPLTQDDRLKIAEQAMSQLADPKSIDQGMHNTCNVTTVETTMYTKHPSDALKVVTDVATTGEYTAPNGKTVKVDPKANDAESQKNPTVDGERSHASQIFQVTSVNLYYQSQPFKYTDADGKVKTVPAGQMEYRQVPNTPGVTPPDGGERLVDKSTTPETIIMKDWKNKVPEASPQLEDQAMVEIPNIMTGAKDATYIANDEYTTPDHAGVKTFKNEQEMKDFIKDAKENGKLPIIIKVHTGQEPFLHDSGGGTAGGSGGWHVVTITDYDESTGKVKLDNQWGSKADHQGDNGVHVDDLFRTTRPPNDTDDGTWYKPWTWNENTTIRDLQKVVDYDREHGSIDTQKELELLRLKNKYDGLDQKDYEEAVQKTMDEAEKRWEQQKKDGTFNQSEYDHAMAKFKDLAQAMPPETKIEMCDKLHSKGVMNDQEYVTALGQAAMKYAADDHTADENQAFLDKVKTKVDTLPEGWKGGYYNFVHSQTEGTTRLELLQAEAKNGGISEATYDQMMVTTTEEFLKGTHTAGESAAYTARLFSMISALPEARQREVLAKVLKAYTPTPAPAPAPATP